MLVTRKIIWLICLIGLMFQGCVYDFYPNINKYDDALVVYGVITNENGPHEIKLSRATTINGYSVSNEFGANVIITDSKGNEIQLTEQSMGTYVTPQTFSGVIGEKYKLSITLKDGNKYESDVSELQDVPEISGLTYEKKIKQATQTSPESKGYQFYLDLDASKINQKYFRWEMSDTWEIIMPYYTNKYWNGDTMVTMTYPSRCWRSAKIPEIYIADVDDYTEKKIANFPLNFTTNQSERLRVKYALEVKQYSLSEASYYFWKGMLENSNQQGSLFDKQPYQVIGNIRNINNSGEIVLGMFEASAVKIRRAIIENPEDALISSFELCKKMKLTELTAAEKKYKYWAYIGYTESFAVLDERCVDCTKTGSSPVMPDYWE